MTQSAPNLPSIERGHPAPPPASRSPSAKKKGLYVRFVTRMSGDLSDAVAAAAREDGVTAGAYVRRMLLDRVGVQSPRDARSGRPIRRPDEDAAAIAAAIRELASVTAAVAVSDEAAAKAGLHEARSLLIPLVVRRPAP